jgi:hypothetical protein
MITLNTWVMVLVLHSFSTNEETVIVKEFDEYYGNRQTLKVKRVPKWNLF